MNKAEALSIALCVVQVWFDGGWLTVGRVESIDTARKVARDFRGNEGYRARVKLERKRAFS